MQKEKRIKSKRIMVRVSDEMYEAFTNYSEENKITKTKIIDDFLSELLKDRLKKDWLFDFGLIKSNANYS